MSDEYGYSYKISLAEIPMIINCHFRYDAYKEFSSEDNIQEIDSLDLDDLSMIRKYQEMPGCESLQNAELVHTIGEVGNILLNHNRCIFHGTSFFWHGKSWIFTGPSGVGKTTQYLLWKFLFGEEIVMMNGDKPILEFREDGEIIVHPSPWKGKEGFGNHFCAPLGGIILLRQGDKNNLRKMEPSQAVVPLYTQFLCFLKEADAIDKLCSLETELLNTVSIWEYTNKGDKSSAVYLHDMLTELELL